MRVIFFVGVFFCAFIFFSYAAETADVHNILLFADITSEKDQFQAIAINPMVDLDGKSKQEVYDFRTQALRQHMELMPQEYRPSEEVFGLVVGGKSWWGIIGQSYYGPGQRSVVGASEETRFLGNPYLLVGLTDVFAHIVKRTGLPPDAVYPMPLSLMWDQAGKTARVIYDITGYRRKATLYHFKDNNPQFYDFELVAYNARDLGFNYLYVDPAQSRNAVSSNRAVTPVLLRQFIHCGGSCGYPGGCNNMSPLQPELYLTVRQLPATASVKLWRNKPLSIEQAADMVFIIQMQ